MAHLKPLIAPKAPKLNSDTIIINVEAWEALMSYIQLQTSTINSLTDTVTLLEKQVNLQTTKVDSEIELLNKEVIELATALEGAYIDE